MIRFISLLISIPLIIIIATFSYRNAQSVKIDFFINIFEIPLAAILLSSLIIGGLLGYLISIFVLIKQKNTIRQLTKQRQQMQGLSNILNKGETINKL